MNNVKYSNRFMEIANIYMVDDVVIKDRNNIDFEKIPFEIVNKNDVIIQIGDYIYCFVSDKTKIKIEKIILGLKNIGRDCSEYIIFR